MENPIKMDDLGKPTIFGHIHILEVYWLVSYVAKLYWSTSWLSILHSFLHFGGTRFVLRSKASSIREGKVGAPNQGSHEPWFLIYINQSGHSEEESRGWRCFEVFCWKFRFGSPMITTLASTNRAINQNTESFDDVFWTMLDAEGPWVFCSTLNCHSHNALVQTHNFCQPLPIFSMVSLKKITACW